MVGGIGIRKNFDMKLLYTFKSSTALISSGYSQGWIGGFPEILEQVKHISALLGSCGPLNIEGRVIKGKFHPFEINPRFSATTYLWAKAGFNDIDLFIRLLCNIPIPNAYPVVEAFALRSFSETLVSQAQVGNSKRI